MKFLLGKRRMKDDVKSSQLPPQSPKDGATGPRNPQSTTAAATTSESVPPSTVGALASSGGVSSPTWGSPGVNSPLVSPSRSKANSTATNALRPASPPFPSAMPTGDVPADTPVSAASSVVTSPSALSGEQRSASLSSSTSAAATAAKGVDRADSNVQNGGPVKAPAVSTAVSNRIHGVSPTRRRSGSPPPSSSPPVPTRHSGATPFSSGLSTSNSADSLSGIGLPPNIATDGLAAGNAAVSTLGGTISGASMQLLAPTTASKSLFPAVGSRIGQASSSQASSPRGEMEDDGVLPLNPFSALPALRDVPPAERQELFRRKLQVCQLTYDFNNVNANLVEKEHKRLTLLEVVEYVNANRTCYTDTIMHELVAMVGANIFRALPPPATTAASGSGASFDPEDEEPALESAWPHLQIVYEFFLRFVVANEVDPKAARRYIDQAFVLKLLELFSSEDPRERDYLKTILHRIYGKIMALRSFIRKAIQNVFFRFMYENEVHKGIAELLEILGSIINGFALPLKDEHKAFLEKSLIPLHKARSLSAFHQQLSYCMTQYVEKDGRLAESVILGLLRFWPVTNTSKEIVFLNELEELLEITQPAEFAKVMEPLFRRMALCIQSPHFQVAERVLFLWNNNYIVELINKNKEQLFPVIISALFRNSKDHWNSTVHGLTYNVSKLLAEADPKLFDDCSDENMALEERRPQLEEQVDAKWAALKAAYSAKGKSNADTTSTLAGASGSGTSSPSGSPIGSSTASPAAK